MTELLLCLEMGMVMISQFGTVLRLSPAKDVSDGYISVKISS